MNDAGRKADADGGVPRGRPVLITGGAGFVGCNLAAKLLADDERVVVLDDLSRPGVGGNLRWLQSRHGDRLRHVAADIRDAAAVRSAVNGASFVFHLAGQVAVTTSLRNPLDDHGINVLGTLNVLEAIRRSRHRPGLRIHQQTAPFPVWRSRTARSAASPKTTRSAGTASAQPLDFISPYGCSKGAADQYVLDYCRSFGLSATVLRMSCIYGPHQQATSDQGWVAHFLRTALARETLTIYGDGRQVRDVLYIDDRRAARGAAAGKRARRPRLQHRRRHGPHPEPDGDDRADGAPQPAHPPVAARRAAATSTGSPRTTAASQWQPGGGRTRTRKKASAGSGHGCSLHPARRRSRLCRRRAGACCEGGGAARRRLLGGRGNRRGGAGPRRSPGPDRGLRRLRLEPPRMAGAPLVSLSGAPGHEPWGRVLRRCKASNRARA